MTGVFILLVILLIYLLNRFLKKKRPPQWLIASVSFCVLYLLVLKFIGGITYIPSASMEPSLMTGDVGISVRLGGLADDGKLMRGDIVVFDAPSVPRTSYIKRIIGLPGDTIVYRQDKAFVVNGKPVGRLISENLDSMVFSDTSERNGKSYTFIIDKKIKFLKSRDEWILPEGFYFMAGDNRDHSWDSRYWENPPGTPKPVRGLVNVSHIHSRYIMTLINLGFYKTYDPLAGELRVIRNNDN